MILLFMKNVLSKTVQTLFNLRMRKVVPDSGDSRRQDPAQAIPKKPAGQANKPAADGLTISRRV